MLEIRNLSAGYAGSVVLDGLNLEVRAGEITAVVGPNGCGKSTLLKAVVGLVEGRGGEVLLDGELLSGMKPGQLARRVAFLPQNRQTPDISVLQLVLHGRFPHLSYPRRYAKRDLEIARAAMDKMGVSAWAERPVGELSGGMRQKAYIAMALAQDAPVILMDEPTTFLDVSQQLRTMEHARLLAQEGRTVLLVLHDLDMALRTAARVAVMKEGRILLSDSPEKVYESGCLEEAFGVSVGRMNTEDGWRYYYRDGAGRREE